MAQKLSHKARIAKRKRDLKMANTMRRKKMRAENQRKRRAAKNKGMCLSGRDYDHTTKSFVSSSRNRSGFGKGTKINNTKRA